MAITKQIITTYAEMAQFLDDSGFFDSVVYDSEDTGSIACKDEDGNTVFAIVPQGTAARWYGYADASNGVYEQIAGVACTAYSTAKGLLFVNTGAGNGAACVVSKTNNGAYCVLLPADYKIAGQSNYANAKQKVIAWGDAAPFDRTVVSGVAFSSVSGWTCTPYVWNQTVFSPIPTQSAYGTPSCFADAFFLPISQFRSETVFTVGQVKYVTDGFVALKDA